MHTLFKDFNFNLIKYLNYCICSNQPQLGIVEKEFNNRNICLNLLNFVCSLNYLKSIVTETS